MKLFLDGGLAGTGAGGNESNPDQLLLAFSESPYAALDRVHGCQVSTLLIVYVSVLIARVLAAAGILQVRESCGQLAGFLQGRPAGTHHVSSQEGR